MEIRKSGTTAVNGMGLNNLSMDELETLHHGACHILNHTGILVEMEEAAQRFRSAGAKVEQKGKHWHVKIPEWLVMESIASVPKSVTYYARDPKKDYQLENRRVGFATFGEQVNVIDFETRECRNTTKADCENVYRIIDALDGLAICQRTVCPGDMSPKTQAAHNFQAMITNNSKHMTIITFFCLISLSSFNYTISIMQCVRKYMYLSIIPSYKLSIHPNIFGCVH